jgi:pyruvate-ferredoxin/flavodoxin oxidoreductase
MAGETRFSILRNIAPARADELLAQAQTQVREHFAVYQRLAQGPQSESARPQPDATKPATSAT